MKEPSEHALKLFSEMLKNYEDRGNRRLYLIPSDIDVMKYLVFCAKTSTDKKVIPFLEKLEL